MKLTLSLLSSVVALGLMLSPVSAKEVQPFGITAPVTTVGMNDTATGDKVKGYDFGHEQGA